jgi:CheY-like chemotaxis protein
MPTDRWTSEVMEAASRESFVEEPDEIDEPVEGSDLLRDASSEQRASLPEDSVSPEVEPPSIESTLRESTLAYSQTPAQDSVDQHADALSQQAPALTPPPDSLTSTEMSFPPPADSPSLRNGDADVGGVNELKRVLLVEDPRTLDESITMALKSEPDLEVVGQTSSAIECGTFVAGEEGLDVVIVNLSLPDSQGIYLIEELRRSCPHVPTLVLTTSLDPRDHERAVEAGADAVLGKDVAPEEIIFMIRRLSGG